MVIPPWLGLSTSASREGAGDEDVVPAVEEVATECVLFGIAAATQISLNEITPALSNRAPGSPDS